MKFAAALTALLSLSFIAQVFGGYFIEIAGENPKEAGKFKGAKQRIDAEQPGADNDDAQSCKSTTEGKLSGLTGGLYKCSTTTIQPKVVSVTVAMKDEGMRDDEVRDMIVQRTVNEEVRCVMAPKDRYLQKSLWEQAYHGASFFMISGARLKDNQILTFNGKQVTKLPAVMMIGFAQQHPDSPGFLQEYTCTARNEIATAPVFEPYLPRTQEEVAALTGLFCCNDPLLCFGDKRADERVKIMKSVNIVIDNISKRMKKKDYLRTPISSKSLQRSGSLQRAESPKRIDSGSKSIKKSESRNDDEVKLTATSSMRNLFKWKSRSWSFSQLLPGITSRSQSGRKSGSQSGRVSGRWSGPPSGTQSPNLSRSASMDSTYKNIALDTEESAAATLSPGKQSEDAEQLRREEERQNLHILIKIMLNSVIDPCYILYLKGGKGRLSNETIKLIENNCKLQCTLMARAAEIGNGSYGKRGCDRIALYRGNCDSAVKACLCHVIEKEAKTVRGRAKEKVGKMINMFSPLKMTYCNNQVRNHLAPISQCT